MICKLCDGEKFEVVGCPECSGSPEEVGGTGCKTCGGDGQIEVVCTNCKGTGEVDNDQ